LWLCDSLPNKKNTKLNFFCFIYLNELLITIAHICRPARWLLSAWLGDKMCYSKLGRVDLHAASISWLPLTVCSPNMTILTNEV
jgi:hypothetical protein